VTCVRRTARGDSTGTALSFVSDAEKSRMEEVIKTLSESHRKYPICVWRYSNKHCLARNRKQYAQFFGCMISRHWLQTFALTGSNTNGLRLGHKYCNLGQGNHLKCPVKLTVYMAHITALCSSWLVFINRSAILFLILLSKIS